MSFDDSDYQNSKTTASQSLSSRAMSFDTIPNGVSAVAEGSQSLSSRAMSFDQEEEHTPKIKEVSIPFEQGNVFRLYSAILLILSALCLNPFRAGQCLSTAAVCWRQESCGLLDPLPNFLEG